MWPDSLVPAGVVVEPPTPSILERSGESVDYASSTSQPDPILPYSVECASNNSPINLRSSFLLIGLGRIVANPFDAILRRSSSGV